MSISKQMHQIICNKLSKTNSHKDFYATVLTLQVYNLIKNNIVDKEEFFKFHLNKYTEKKNNSEIVIHCSSTQFIKNSLKTNNIFANKLIIFPNTTYREFLDEDIKEELDIFMPITFNANESNLLSGGNLIGAVLKEIFKAIVIDVQEITFTNNYITKVKGTSLFDKEVSLHGYLVSCKDSLSFFDYIRYIPSDLVQKERVTVTYINKDLKYKDFTLHEIADLTPHSVVSLIEEYSNKEEIIENKE